MSTQSTKGRNKTRPLKFRNNFESSPHRDEEPTERDNNDYNEAIIEEQRNTLIKKASISKKKGKVASVVEQISSSDEDNEDEPIEEEEEGQEDPDAIASEDSEYEEVVVRQKKKKKTMILGGKIKAKKRPAFQKKDNLSELMEQEKGTVPVMSVEIDENECIVPTKDIACNRDLPKVDVRVNDTVCISLKRVTVDNPKGNFKFDGIVFQRWGIKFDGSKFVVSYTLHMILQFFKFYLF